MKNIVIADEFKGVDFKPSELLKEYLDLISREVGEFFKPNILKAVPCPACGVGKSAKAFAKFGLAYQECLACATLYVSPRPSDADIIRFYKTSQARKFWNERLYGITAVRRQEKIIKPRFQWIEDSIQEYLPAAQKYADFNANQRGYVAGIGLLPGFSSRTLVNPLAPLAPKDVPAGVTLDERPWQEVKGTWDVISLFEVLDHTSDVEALFRTLHSSLPKGGLVFLTSILGSGFDIQTLWGNAEGLYPPDRLNLVSVEGLNTLSKRHGFEVLEFSTPGILDVEIVAKTLEADPTLELPRFVRYLLNRPEHERRAFQEFLQANLLSSYARILIRKT